MGFQPKNTITSTMPIAPQTIVFTNMRKTIRCSSSLKRSMSATISPGERNFSIAASQYHLNSSSAQHDTFCNQIKPMTKALLLPTGAAAFCLQNRYLPPLSAVWYAPLNISGPVNRDEQPWLVMCSCSPQPAGPRRKGGYYLKAQSLGRIA